MANNYNTPIDIASERWGVPADYSTQMASAKAPTPSFAKESLKEVSFAAPTVPYPGVPGPDPNRNRRVVRKKRRYAASSDDTTPGEETPWYKTEVTLPLIGTMTWPWAVAIVSLAGYGVGKYLRRSGLLNKATSFVRGHKPTGRSW